MADLGEFTRRAYESINNSIIEDINSENMKLLVDDGSGIIDFLKDTSTIITADYVLRRYITEHRDELEINWPKGCSTDATDKKPWSDDNVKNITEQINNLAKKKKACNSGDFGSFKIEPFLVPNENTKYKPVSIYKIAFLLGMKLDDALKFMLALDGRCFNMHKAEDIAAYFCLSNKSFNNYNRYVELKNDIEKILNNTKINTEEKENIPMSNNVTNILRGHVYNDLMQDTPDIPDDEMKAELIADIRNNAEYIKYYTGSTSDRELMLNMIKDLRIMYEANDVKEHDENKTDCGYVNEKIGDIIAKIEKEKCDIPESISNALNGLKSDISTVANGLDERDTSGKKYKSKIYRVRRRDILLLAFLLLSEYVDNKMLWGQDNAVATSDNDKVYIPETLKEESNDDEDTILESIDKFLENHKDHIGYSGKIDNKYYYDKRDIYIRMVDYYMCKTGFAGFYAANELDRFTLLLFLTDTPVVTLSSVTGI